MNELLKKLAGGDPRSDNRIDEVVDKGSIQSGVSSTIFSDTLPGIWYFCGRFGGIPEWGVFSP
jgi:hypothetical protein